MEAVFDWLISVAVSVIEWAIAHPVAAAITAVVIIVGSAYLRDADDPLLKAIGYILPVATNLFLIAGIYGYGAALLWEGATAGAAAAGAAAAAAAPDLLTAGLVAAASPTPYGGLALALRALFVF